MALYYINIILSECTAFKIAYVFLRLKFKYTQVHIQCNEAHYFFTRDILCFSFPGEPVKIELIQLIPPGTTDIISQILLNK